MKVTDILSLMPTQFVLGMKEVDAKIKKMKRMNEEELILYCHDHLIPIVLGPFKRPFMIDHHHFARACWELKVDKYKVKVVADLRHLSEQEFWNYMDGKEWTYLHDQFGLGPHSPKALPVDVRSMADDPYRSLVWMLIDEGVIRKIRKPFFEFLWATFFRANLEVRLHSKSDFKKAQRLAKELALSKMSAHLPGYKTSH